MVPFKEHLYEATLFAVGKILSRYNAFAQELILKKAGREIFEYLKRQGYEFPNTARIDGILKVIDVFTNNGFVENLEVEEAGEATEFTWHNLYGFEAYRELQEITENPFLSCPLNAVLWYLADGLGKTLKLRDKRFIEEGRTAVSVEQFVDKDAEGPQEQDGVDPLVPKNPKLLKLAEQQVDKLEKIPKEVKTLYGLLPICANCKKIRDDQGYWKRLEHYLQEHSQATFSHGLCPDCLGELHPELAEAIIAEAEGEGEVAIQELRSIHDALYKRESELNARLELVVQATEKLAACRDGSELNRRLVEIFANNMAAEGASLFICHEDHLELTHSLEPEHVPLSLPLPLPENSIFYEVLTSTKPVLIRDIERENTVRSSGWKGYKNGSLLVFPLTDETGRVMAVLSLHNKKWPPFTQQDLYLGQILGSLCIETLRCIRTR